MAERANGQQADVRGADARKLWKLFEPYHAVVYFAPERSAFYARVGLKGGWMGYFASRGAALGPVPPEVIIATFYNFAPEKVRRAIPDAWRLSDPEAILAARLEVADVVLHRLLGDMVASPVLGEAAELARAAAEVAATADLTGRPLFAAHAALPWPDEPHLVLWQAATLLREHRGDGHMTQLLSAGIDGCEANVLMEAATKQAGRGMSAGTLRALRGWSEEEWASASARLIYRGWLEPDGTLSQVAQDHRQVLEDRTDALAVLPWVRLGSGVCRRLEELLEPIADKIWEGEGVPDPSPVGLSRS